MLSALLWSSCKDVDAFDVDKEINEEALTVSVFEEGSPTILFDALVDNVAKKISITVPYYISDTEEIKADLSKMRLNLSLPVGVRLLTPLTGIQDLSKTISITLEYMNGKQQNYDIITEVKKSNKADILKFTFPEHPLVTIKMDSKDGENRICILRTSSTLYDILKKVKVNMLISPWAKAAVENGTIMDLTKRQKITLTAQDGTTKDYYTEIVDPEYVPYGEIGTISLLFGWQVTPENPRGFEVNANRSIAIANDELVVSRDKGDFLRFNRFTGEKLDKTVNTSGTPSVGVIMGIAGDDKGTLLAVTFSIVGNASFSPTVDFYVWKDGLDNPPTKIMSKPTAELIPSGDIARTVSVKGDMLGGQAQIGLIAKTIKRGFLFKVVKGEVVNANNPWVRNYGVTFGNSGKIIPLSGDDDPNYILSGITGRTQYYGTSIPPSTLPISASADWWGSDIKGSAYIEFNGVKLLATQNGFYDSNNKDAYNRLVIADITTYSKDVFSKKRIMDSRLQNFDPNVSGTANPTITGMTSSYKALGDNGNKIGDICFGYNEDGSAVQVYMITTSHGVIAYDITRFAPF